MNRDQNDLLDQTGMELRAGTITEDRFVRLNAERWRKTASILFSRWRRRLPAHVEREDVEQELVLLALRYVRSWSPDRGTSLASYVHWCSVHRTQRCMDHWRGASLSGNSGKNPGSPEVEFSRLHGVDDEPPGNRFPGMSDDPLDRIESGEEFERVLRHCRSVRQALVLLALRATDGSIDKAARALCGNFRAKLECEIRSDQHARVVVREVFEELQGLLGCIAEQVRPPDGLFEDASEGAA